MMGGTESGLVRPPGVGDFGAESQVECSWGAPPGTVTPGGRAGLVLAKLGGSWGEWRVERSTGQVGGDHTGSWTPWREHGFYFVSKGHLQKVLSKRLKESGLF